MEDNIKMDLKGMKWEGVGWIQLSQDRDKWRAFVNAVMNLGVPWNGGIFWLAGEFVKQVCFMDRTSIHSHKI